VVLNIDLHSKFMDRYLQLMVENNDNMLIRNDAKGFEGENIGAIPCLH